jgi:hypothetical protein
MYSAWQLDERHRIGFPVRFVFRHYIQTGSEVNRWVLGGSASKVKRPEREARHFQLSILDENYKVSLTWTLKYKCWRQKGSGKQMSNEWTELYCRWDFRSVPNWFKSHKQQIYLAYFVTVYYFSLSISVHWWHYITSRFDRCTYIC